MDSKMSPGGEEAHNAFPCRENLFRWPLSGVPSLTGGTANSWCEGKSTSETLQQIAKNYMWIGAGGRCKIMPVYIL